MTVRQAIELPAGVRRELVPLTAQDGAAIDGALYVPSGGSPRTALVLLHPTVSFLEHYALAPLAELGFAALGLNSRFAGNEGAVLLEQCVLDLAAGVACLRERGYERVVLVGNSGGGALSSLYQAQAEHPTVTSTPGGLPVDLTRAELPRADALIVLNAHRGRAQVLTEWMDPAVVAEDDLLATDPDLDLFGDAARPPYPAVFVERYRAAQVARNRRITAWARAQLDALVGRGIRDRAFTVHRTAADPRFVDLALDPSDRTVGTYSAPDVRAANYAARGLARFTSLQSWLSVWALDETHGVGEACLGATSVPLLCLQGTADQGIYPSDARAWAEAARVDDVELHWITGGTHYFLDQPAQQREVFGRIASWLAARGLSG